MTFYHQQIVKINTAVYSKDYLCKQVVQAKRFIDKNFAGDINLDAIAREAFLSKFHFIRLFKAMYGTTPNQYLASVRISKAKQFLQSGFTVSQACTSVGFNSASSFAKLFKKNTGVLPSLFAERKNKPLVPFVRSF